MKILFIFMSSLLLSLSAAAENKPTTYERLKSAAKGCIELSSQNTTEDGKLELIKSSAKDCYSGALSGFNLNMASEDLKKIIDDEAVTITAEESHIQILLSSDEHFISGSYELSPALTENLNLIVELMNNHESVNIVIQGHTDNVGSNAFNQVLSHSRAKEVQLYFIGQGIDYNRTQAHGLGSEFPKCENDTNSGQACNRRIELKLSTI